MYQYLRAYAWMTAATGYCGARAFLRHIVLAKRRSPAGDTITSRWGSLCMRGARVRMVVRNRERLDTGSGKVLVSNHQSWFDIFALGALLDRRFGFVGKKELSRVPLLGAVWERVGHIAIDRSNRAAAIASMERAAAILRDGWTIVLFPEGTRSVNGQVARFKKGAAVMAINSQVPLLPVAIHGTSGVMGKGDWRVRPGTVRVAVGEPISTEGLTLSSRNRLAERCRGEVVRLLERERERACRR